MDDFAAPMVKVVILQSLPPEFTINSFFGTKNYSSYSL